MKLKTTLIITQTALDTFYVLGKGNISRGVERAVKIADNDQTAQLILNEAAAYMKGSSHAPAYKGIRPPRPEEQATVYRCENGHQLTEAQYDRFEMDGCPQCNARKADEYKEAIS